MKNALSVPYEKRNMNYFRAGLIIIFAREIPRRERATPAVPQPPRRKDFVIYGVSGYLFSAGTGDVDDGTAPSTCRTISRPRLMAN